MSNYKNKQMMYVGKNSWREMMFSIPLLLKTWEKEEIIRLQETKDLHQLF